MYKLQSVPCNQETLLLYVAFLNIRKLRLSSIKVYLAAVRSLHITEGHCNPLEGCLRLDLALRAIGITNGPSKQKLPMTQSILQKIRNRLDNSYNSKLIWAAMTLGHFGLLRASEFSVPDNQPFNVSMHLTMDAVAFERLTDKTGVLRVKIKRSKTDKYNRGIDIYIGCSGDIVCAYCAMVDFLECRKRLEFSAHSPLFFYPNGAILTKSILVKNTKLYLALVGKNPNDYSGHSYRIGGATTMASQGMSDWEI